MSYITRVRRNTNHVGHNTTMSSIGLASGGTKDISTISNEEKDQLIIPLQQELDMLREQVEEFNDLWMSVIKTTGKKWCEEIERTLSNYNRQGKC